MIKNEAQHSMLLSVRERGAQEKSVCGLLGVHTHAGTL